MAYHIVVHCGGGAFFVPTEVTENLCRISGEKLRVLLLSLSKGGVDISPENIADELSMSTEDVKHALDYWCTRGILESDTPVSAILDDNASETTEEPAKKPDERISIKEVRKLQENNSSFDYVLKETEVRLGGSFTTWDTESMGWLISSSGLSPEVILTIVEYCRTVGRPKVRFVLKTATEWLDAGIDTVEKSEERIRTLIETAGWEGEMKHLLCIYDRSLITKEKELFASWKMLGFSPELIKTAYEITVENTGKRSLNYMNKILLNWKQKGITTPEDAENDRASLGDKNKPSFNLSEFEQRMMTEDSVF